MGWWVGVGGVRSWVFKCREGESGEARRGGLEFFKDGGELLLGLRAEEVDVGGFSLGELGHHAGVVGVEVFAILRGGGGSKDFSDCIDFKVFKDFCELGGLIRGYGGAGVDGSGGDGEEECGVFCCGEELFFFGGGGGCAEC